MGEGDSNRMQKMMRDGYRETMMYMVYWVTSEEEESIPHARQFESSDMLGAMKFMEELRTRQRAGEALGFVALASENPHSVGHPGVAETGPDYHWKKRRR
jgi:hypothetical protein